MLPAIENPRISCSEDAVSINGLITSQIQAYHALGELVEDIPPIPEACRGCPHGGDLHCQRIERFRWLASGLMLGISTMIRRFLHIFGGSIALLDGVMVKSRTDRQRTSSGC